MPTAYLFELRQIQPYVFGTGKLRDASGASELIESISFDSEIPGATGAESIDGVAGDLLKGLEIQVYRAAGGVIDIVGPDEGPMTEFRAAFRLALARHAPGLVYGDSLATAPTEAEAREKARMTASDDGPVQGTMVPPGSPMIRPAPRSGGSPAVMSGWTTSGRCTITHEFADLSTLAKRQYLKERQRLAEKFVPADLRDKKWNWPTVFSLEDDAAAQGSLFPFDDGVLPRIAVLHADGNGMGNLFARAVKTLSSDKVRDLSRGLTAATRSAVQEAMRQVLAAHRGSVPPARPILLGGDDVTLILRADLVSDFALTFAETYQAEASAVVKSFEIKTDTDPAEDWPAMTTKIGFVVIGPSQPFARAYDLAASLASTARDTAKSRIAFHRVAGAEIPADADALKVQGQCVPGFTLWRAGLDLAAFRELRALSRMLDNDDIGRGPLRQVPALLKVDLAEARRIYRRAEEVIEPRNPGAVKDLRDRLAALGFDGSWTPGPDDNPVWCPLLAAHHLAHVDRKPG